MTPAVTDQASVVRTPSGIWISDTVVSVKTWFMKPEAFGLGDEVTEWLIDHTPGWFMYDSTDLELPRLISFRTTEHATLFSEKWDSLVVEYVECHYYKELTNKMVTKCLDKIKGLENDFIKRGLLD